MKIGKDRVGELLIFFEAILWGLFPIMTTLSQNKLPSLISLGFSTLFSCIFFGSIIIYKHKWQELRNTSALADILIATTILGILFYLLFFFGLRYTSPGNASIIALSEIFFSYLYFHVWKKDDLPREHIVGAILIVIGVVIIFYPSIHSFQIGDLLVLTGAFIAPFGNFYQKRARSKVSSETILFIRSFLSSIVVFFLAFLFQNSFSYDSFNTSLIFLLINGVLVLGLSKVLWVEGIHRISVMKATALGSIAPLITLIFAFILLQKTPTIYQLLAFVPMFFGVIFLSRNKQK